MNLRLATSAGLALLIAIACGGGTTPAPTPGPTPGPALTVAELKLAITDRFGPLWYCDPDFYPIQRQDELASARERWPEVVADAEALEALAARAGLDPAGQLSDEQQLAVYRDWKVLNAIALDPIGNERYRFDYLAQPAAGAAEGTRSGGTITASGAIDIELQVAAPEPMCPICLSRGTLIDTPGGPVAVEALRIGDPVWTLGADGVRTHGTVIAFGSTVAPAGHRVVRLLLADGRTVSASPGHPLADGRLLGEMRVGDDLGGSTVLHADLLAYASARTYDIAVGGPTGIYLVSGIALGSTLQP